MLTLLGASGVGAQPFDRAERRNFWNAGRNVTGLRTDTLTVSCAELYGRGAHGGLRDYSEASEAWSAGAVARTITRLERISMAGSFAFDHTSGREMSGSMFIRPGYYPVDVQEFTPGRKELQTYAFTGGIAADAAPRWRIGAKMEFTAQNYAKRKDLRHTNYRLDMTVMPGVMYHAGGGAVGLAYVYGKNSERISAEEIGAKATNYPAFLDKGLMYGAQEIWTGSGVHLSESGISGFPVKEITHGAAVQGQWKGFYAEVEYLYSVGKVGEKQTLWFEFPAHRITARAAYRFRRGDNLHFLRLTVARMRQVNDETVLKTESSNGISTPTVYGTTRIFERQSLSVNPEYEWTGAKGEVRGGGEISTLDGLSSLMYPYLFSERVMRWRVYASGMVRLGRFDLRAGAAFARGSRSAKSRVVDTQIEAGEYPYRPQESYDLHDEYLTAPRLTAELSLRFNFGRGLYAEAGAAFTRGFDLRFIGGTDRWCETLKLGYTF